MKKIYLLATALFIGANINAQSVIDFESFSLPAAIDTFNNGSAGGGDFTIDYATFSNNYNMSWGSWTGFSVSNMTDTITPGYGNQYSAFIGEGADNSTNYGVFYEFGSITTDGSVKLNSFKITNMAYAAISMRDGDAYGKKFGDSLDANGINDGTNGEDFFKVWVMAEDLVGSEKDSVEFFLADFRFADSLQDYIVDSWETVDLSAITFDIQKLSFRMESSDNGAGWMNTPAYFAIDNIDAQPIQGINELSELSINAYPNPVRSNLTITGDNGQLTIHDVNGTLLYQLEHNDKSIVDLTHFSNGVYFLKIENELGSVTRKIIK